MTGVKHKFPSCPDDLCEWEMDSCDGYCDKVGCPFNANPAAMTDQVEAEKSGPQPRAADDFDLIRARMEELKRERQAIEEGKKEKTPDISSFVGRAQVSFRPIQAGKRAWFLEKTGPGQYTYRAPTTEEIQDDAARELKEMMGDG